MLDAPPRGPEWRSWLVFGVAASAVLATVPLARALVRAVEEHADAELLRVGVFGLVGVAALGAGVALGRARRLAPGRLAWIFGVAALYALASARLCERPEEAIHFVEYGVLAALAFRALGHRVRDAGIYVAAAGLGIAVGILDEGLQWLAPLRIWDLRDVGLNALGAVLVQPALVFGLRPAWVRPRPAARGVRAAALALALAWLLLGASLLLTPDRIARMGGLPLAGEAAARGDVLLEYGHRIEDPEVGVFRSRLAPEALRRADRERAAEVGAILRREGADEDYDAFLRRYNPITDPFLHEMRVHLFRRDRYRATAENHPEQEDWYRSDLTVAWRENRILERWFGESLVAAGRGWPEPERAYVATHQDAGRHYASPVSDGLVTEVTPREVAIVWAGGLALLAGAAWVAGRRLPAGGAGRQAAPLSLPGSS